MTAQLSREDIRELRSDLSSWQEDYSPTLDAEKYQLFDRAMTAMDMLLAGIDSDKNLRDFAASQTTLGADVERTMAGSLHDLYLGCDTAPPAPVSVPDERAAFESFMAERFGGTIDRSRVKNGDEEYFAWDMAVAWIVWQGRAAMLKAGPVTGWIKCSDRMPEEGGRYWCYVEEQNSLGKSHYQWNCSWNGDEWSDKALTGRVTHWMPLPAAPEQEV